MRPARTITYIEIDGRYLDFRSKMISVEISQIDLVHGVYGPLAVHSFTVAIFGDRNHISLDCVMLFFSR